MTSSIYAPISQQNLTAYYLATACVAPSQHLRRLANGPTTNLQAYNKQITQATYTLLWAPLFLFVIEPTGVLEFDSFGTAYAFFTWTFPMLLIFPAAILLSSNRRYRDTRLLLQKATIGSRVIEGKLRSTDVNEGEREIRNEDKSRRKKEE